ncbi:protein CHUP1, chloroplastic [Quillaja saponaria]|uniref:Protein CHUP1, chloroplastic n=1 Tax=Quillaja saponaria TaxID=32244 RepID=A0AAD7LAB0_QUISA|nr:protein CHUP1, chloroplastic [Quillaja saponaria]
MKLRWQNASELERLRNLVKELEEREVKLEGELLEYYGLKRGRNCKKRLDMEFLPGRSLRWPGTKSRSFKGRFS